MVAERGLGFSKGSETNLVLQKLAGQALAAAELVGNGSALLWFLVELRLARCAEISDF